MAWLNAVPRAPDNAAKKDERSRMKRLMDQERSPKFPEVSCMPLVEQFLEIGPCMAGAMGPVPLSEEELAHFQGNRGIEIEPWVVNLYRRLSGDYCSQASKAQEPNAPPPFYGPLDDWDRASIAKSLKAIIRGMAS